MKNIIILVILLTFMACPYYYEKIDDFWTFDLPEFRMRDERDCGWYIAHNFTYREDFSENWNKPSETQKYKEGDCDDLAIFMMALLKASFPDCQVSLAVVDKNGDGIEDHCDLIYNGRQINYLSIPSTDHILYTISYDELPKFVRRAF